MLEDIDLKERTYAGLHTLMAALLISININTSAINIWARQKTISSQDAQDIRNAANYITRCEEENLEYALVIGKSELGKIKNPRLAPIELIGEIDKLYVKISDYKEENERESYLKMGEDIADRMYLFSKNNEEMSLLWGHSKSTLNFLTGANILASIYSTLRARRK